ncbi:MAG: TetR/AcrR family transcriptional regulator [Opitutales bacterium]|jgi:AcrR family transcriptional regulator|nr:TetR/AcrR family transcriptional regulator [Opitutales bacterium]MDG2166418.1 TetR/AcrR family transcriptional regulator [Opitutales bacterium]
MPTVEPPKNKRDELVQIASRLFYEQGYHRTGVKQIIDEAGIAKGTFYSHFKSKEDLAVAWLKARHTTWSGMMDEFLGQMEANDPVGKIMAIFDFLENWMPGADYRGCAFLNTLTETPEGESPLRLEIEDHKRGLLALIRGYVAAHRSQESEDEITQIARSIFILFEGALIEMQNFRDVWPAQAAKKQVSRLLS